jgi:pyruvate,water dikinase
MSDMERSLQGSQSFGMAFIRAGCTAISVNAYKMIQNVNEISSHRYDALYEVFEKIGDTINPILEEPNDLPGGELILPFEAVNRDVADQVGSKMANLGEIKNRLGCPVPEGFVVSAASQRLFLSYNQLQEEINRRIQLLDLEDIQMLQKASADIQQLIMHSPLPLALDQALTCAYEQLDKKTRGTGINVSLRTSILGEDEERTSFAGHYRSILNVGGSDISRAYRKALATKYAPEALTYRLHAGFRDEHIAMCVGIMAMVDAVAGGVMYSRDPGDIRNNIVVIHAVWGLPKPVVDGTASPDVFLVSKDSPMRILGKEIGGKESQFVCLPEEGICLVKSEGNDKDAPCLTEEQALALARLATDLEAYYGSPKEIQWSVDREGHIHILQIRASRKRVPGSVSLGKKNRSTSGRPILVEGGQPASPGVASGPAFLVNNAVDLQRFPVGGILLAKYSLPRWAAVLRRAAAVVTDRGSINGDLATLCLEMEIPALFDTLEATKKIADGDVITVDADGCRVFAGRSGSLLEEASTPRANPMKGSPVYHTLQRLLEHIAPLNLTDPEERTFSPQACQTFHDIIRFCHEKSVTEMFSFAKGHDFPERTSPQLRCEIPMKWWVMDLDDGFKETVHGDTVVMENIASIPMLAIWEGIMAKPWQGPPPVDTKGLLSVMFRSTMDPSLNFTKRSPYAEKNYFMISKHFCDLTCRFGYHLTTVQAFINDRAKENYVRLSFRGGGADYERRVLRIRFIERILKKFDFRIRTEDDFMNAQIEGYDADFLIKRLKVLGYLVVHTRQLDMAMANQAAVDHYMKEHLGDIYALFSSRG